MSEKDCFVIMPISTPEGYEEGHFDRVYEDILKPACLKANYKPVRADDVKQTNLIHTDILEKLIKSEMVLCDLSSTNPNVLFELGLRQAFDKPVTLVQEKETKKIFDISVLRVYEYRRERKYNEVLEDQENIAEQLVATREAFNENSGINSIIRLLSYSQAELKDASEFKKDPNIEVLRAEIGNLRNDIKELSKRPKNSKQGVDIELLTELTDLSIQLNKFKKIVSSSNDESEKQMIQNLLFNIQDKAYELDLNSNNPEYASILHSIHNDINMLQNKLAS